MIDLDRMIHALLVIVSTTAVDPTTVAIVPLCDALPSSESAAWMALALSEQGWQVVPVAEASSQPCMEYNRGRLQATFREARGLFEEQLRHEAAQIKLTEAAQLFERQRTLFGVPALYAKVEFYLGWIAFEAGRSDEARRHFARVARVVPDWRPSPRRFPPRVLTSFAQAAARVQASQGGLKIEASPIGAEVWLDGNKRCGVPCQLDGLAAGPHFAAVRSEGYASHLELLTIEPDTTVTLQVELRSDPRERLVSLLDAGDEVALVELAWTLGPGAVVLVAPAPQGQVSLVATGSALAETRSWQIAATREAVAGVARSLGSPPGSVLGSPPGSAVPPPGEAQDDGEEPWLLSQWWFWTAIGVATATGVAVGVTRHRDVHFTVRP